MADRAGWQETAAAELRALGRELDLPPPADHTAAVRRRLEGPPGRRLPVPGTRELRRWRSAWRVALVVVVTLLAVLITTPQGRAVISHVFRFVGIELRQPPGPGRSPATSAPLPGEQRMTLEQARRHVSFAILVPAALGRPDEVVVSDAGRVASLVYRRTPYGQLRMDEFAGRLDPVYFQKFVRFGQVTEVEVNGAKGLWIKGPHQLLYITREGVPVAASARLTTGNTLIWGTRQVALRLEGPVGKNQALAIADSAG
ncbi:MAG TPA: hypothetical protein VIV12_18035 [Streptosporangiaceae bacterium]